MILRMSIYCLLQEIISDLLPVNVLHIYIQHKYTTQHNVPRRTSDQGDQQKQPGHQG